MSVTAIAIIGAGEAGARAAAALREHGYSGSLTLIGDEPHGPYERPPLSKAIMTVAAAESPPLILDEAKLGALNITHLASAKATRIDTVVNRVMLDSGRSLPYGKLLIATGARARRLPTPGASLENVLYLRTFADALAMRQQLLPGSRLAIIGGGFIGLEVAASAIGRGCAVTLIETASRILIRAVPAAIADRVRARHEAAGVIFRTGVEIVRITRCDEGEVIALADGSSVECDVIIAGIGAVPETALAEASGLDIENGIRVDHQLRTSDVNIFAAGDCCSFPHPLYGGRRLRLEAWRNAQDQGITAARNMLGGSETYAAIPWFWSDQYDQTLQVAGLADEATRTIERDLGKAVLFFHLASDGRLVGVSGIGSNNLIARDVRVAEIMIARRFHPDVDRLASPSIKLKSLL